MKRDMDLCREILRALEEFNEHTVELKTVVAAVDKPMDVCYHHCHILFEAGLLDERKKELTQKLPNPGYSAPRGQFDETKAYTTVSTGKWIAYSLTWQGHEFLDQSRNPQHWERAKDLARSSGTWSFSVIVDILKTIVIDAWTKNVTA